MLLSSMRRSRPFARRGADAEQQIEHGARVADHRQRLIRRRPADRVGIGARVAIRAAARLVDVLDAQLHRRNRGALAVLLRVVLIDRRADEDVRALRLLRMHLRQEHRARAEVIAADFRRRERLGVPHVGVADDRDVVAERLERREAARRQVELAAHRRRRPQVLLDAERRAAGGAVHHLDGRKANLAAGGLRRGAGRNHGLEERQRHGDAGAP